MTVESDLAKTESSDSMGDRPAYVMSTFAKHLGETFCIHVESGAPRSVQLVEATAHSQDRAEDPKNFALLFYDPDASVNDHLAQSLYNIEHPSLGTQPLFIVPVGPGSNGRGINYEAVFTCPN